MKITATTTDDAITQKVRLALRALANAANNAAAGLEQSINESEELAATLISLAEAEGTAYAELVYRDALAADRDPKIVAFSHLATPVNDTWSGRRNDVRRARHEALVRRLGDLARFGN